MSPIHKSPTAKTPPGIIKVSISQLKIDEYILINDRPCKIREMGGQKSGLKHRVHIIAFDIFTGKRLEKITPYLPPGRELREHQAEEIELLKKPLDAPVIRINYYILQDIGDDGFLTVYDEVEGVERGDLKLPVEGERAMVGPGGDGGVERWKVLREQIRRLFDEEKVVVLTVVSAECCGEAVVVGASESVG